MSGGHLCEAEAPTEPTGETAAPYEKLKYNSVGGRSLRLPVIIIDYWIFSHSQALAEIYSKEHIGYM